MRSVVGGLAEAGIQVTQKWLQAAGLTDLDPPSPRAEGGGRTSGLARKVFSLGATGWLAPCDCQSPSASGPRPVAAAVRVPIDDCGQPDGHAERDGVRHGRRGAEPVDHAGHPGTPKSPLPRVVASGGGASVGMGPAAMSLMPEGSDLAASLTQLMGPARRPDPVRGPCTPPPPRRRKMAPAAGRGAP